MTEQTPPPYPYQLPMPTRPLPIALAVTSLICAILAVLFIAVPLMSMGLGLVAVLFAIVQLHQIHKLKATGRGMAIWALVIGVLFSLVGIVNAAKVPQGQVSAAALAAQPTPTVRSLPPQLPASAYYVAPVAEPPAKPQVVNPKTIALAVDANKARAERDWNGKFVQFSAEVTDISTFLGPSVQFGKVTGQAFSLVHFLCMPAEDSDLIPYTKGEKATVRGVVEVGIGGVIKLTSCERVD
jgi:hypothetical protein